MSEPDLNAPIDYEWKPTSLMDVPQEMVYSIAMGLEEPADIAERHGFYGAKWEKLQAWKPFRDAVAAQRAEFEKTGLTFRIKQALKADLVSEKVFLDAMGPDVPLMQRIEALKIFAKLGQLEPKEDKLNPQGTSFSISIDLGERSVSISNEPAQRIEAPRKRFPAEDVVDVQSRAFGVVEE